MAGDIGRRLFGIRFTGPYPSWEDAVRRSKGYDTRDIAERAAAATRLAAARCDCFERDGAIVGPDERPWPVLAGLALALAAGGNRLRVLDFGGSLGSTYRMAREFLLHVEDLKWAVVEQPHIAETGRREFSTGRLSFHDDLDSGFRTVKPNVLVLSSVLQYLPSPYSFAGTAVGLGIPFVIIDRTPFSRAGGDVLTVQHNPRRLGGSSYPCWHLDRTRLLEKFGVRYDIVAEFESTCDRPTPLGSFRGAIMRRR